MTQTEALRLALEAFGEIAWSNQTQWQSDRAKVAITAIKAALEAKDEPVADFYITKAMAEHIKNLEVDWKICASGNKRPTDKKVVPVFVGDTTPPQRTWVGLTEAECGVLWKVSMTPFDYYKAIEAKLKEKNT